VTRLLFDLRTIGVLVRRDLLLFFRQKGRVAGAVAQTLLIWLVLGAGMSPAFRPAGGGGYLEFFYPGALLMLLLLSSVAASISVIEDRHRGFLQAVLVGPGSRAALALGKSFGSSAICLAEAALFLLLSPWAGFPPTSVRWGSLIGAVCLTTVGLNALGFVLAWILDSTQAYHVAMSVLLFPLWILSGAVFPPTGLPPALAVAVRADPLSYALAAMRRALCGGSLPQAALLPASFPWLEFGVVAALAVVGLAGAAWVARSARAS
jgi:ABC-type multidrug transport system permease subunit